MTTPLTDQNVPTAGPARANAADNQPAGLAERAMWTVLRVVQSAIEAAPLRAALWFGRRLGELAYYVVYPRTRVALDQMAWAIPEWSSSRRRATVRGMYRQFGQGAVEFFRLRRMVAGGELNRLVTVENEHVLRDELARGKGVLILTAHFGNFEMLAAVFAARGYQVNMVTRKLRNSILERFLVEQRRGLNVRAISKEQSLKEVIGRLRRNEIAGYVLDQNMGPGQGVFVNFFGRPASTLNAVAVLAKRFGSPVVPVFISRDPLDPTRHRVVCEPPLKFETRGGVEEGAAEADRAENTQRYTAIIEQRIRERPDHWIWIHKRWKTRPPADA